MEYEIEAIDFWGKPSILQKMLAVYLGWRYVWHEDQECWALHRKVKGNIIDGWFVPSPGQSVEYKIFANEELRKELKLQENP